MLLLWLTDWLTDWLNEWMTEWLTYFFVYLLTYLLACLLTLGTLNPICIFDFDNETLNHLFLHSPWFIHNRQKPLLKIERIIHDIFSKTDTSITSTLLFSNPSFSVELNTNIINSSIDYILSTKWFESTLVIFCYLALFWLLLLGEIFPNMCIVTVC